MFKRIISLLFFCAALFGLSVAGDRPDDSSITAISAGTDLYNVQVLSRNEAEILIKLGVDPLMKIEDGYLVLADENQGKALAATQLSYTLLAKNINRHQLAIDVRYDRSNIGKYPAVYENGNLRLYRIDPEKMAGAKNPGLAPILTEDLQISYKPPVSVDKSLSSAELAVPLDSLIALMLQDSLESYTYWIQDYGERPGEANYGVASDLAERFRDFGYDSVYLDEFYEPGIYSIYDPHIYHGWNVIATKVGTLYPYDHIIIGAHLDSYQSPGADDNGSGMAAVLEMARVLRDIETKMTILFIIFDVEEEGCLGAWNYAKRSDKSRERIPFMINLDMIAYYKNTDYAKLYTGPNTEFAEIWMMLNDSLPSLGLTGYLCGHIGADHAPFEYFGYDVVFVHEYIFNRYYHTAQDSTIYMNFEYMTRMAKASLATVYYVDGTYIPPPALILSCPEGLPELIPPGSEDTVRIHVEEYCGAMLAPGSVSLNCSLNNGPKFILPMTDLGGGDYEVALPPMVCGDLLTYHVMAVETVEECIYRYPDPKYPANSIMTSSKQVLLGDSFESDLGWTVSGDATSGHWIRYQALANSSLPKHDFDSSGRMYMTDYLVLKDVDNGSTILESPEIDVSHGKTTVEYARCFYNGLGLTGKTDVFRIYINDAAGWVKIDSAGPKVDNDGKWVYRKFWLHDIRPSTVPVQLRFWASDEGLDSEVEAAVDAVKIIHYSVAPQIYTESVPSTLIGTEYNLQFEASGCYDPLTWSDKYGELEETGLTFSPDGILSGTPVDTGTFSFTAYVEDATGIANEKDYVFQVRLPLICSDATMDYQINVGDAVFLINYIFRAGAAPNPECVGDANGDEAINVGDAVYLINHIFKGGPPVADGCCY